MSRCGECATELERENEETAHLYAEIERLKAAAQFAYAAIDKDCVFAARCALRTALEGK